MKNSLIGRFAISGAGHDRGTVYLIIAEDAGYLELTDGRFHPSDRPKKKNKKHVQLMNRTAGESLLERLYNKERIFDYEIKYAIKTVAGKEERHV